MDAKSKRREATRRQLEQQLKERQAREARRKRATLIASVVGTVAVVALIIVLVVVFAGGSDSKKKTASSKSASATPSATAASTSAAPLAAPVACTAPTGKKTASFDGVTVGNAINLKKDPKVTSKSAATPDALGCDDLVVGKGKAATASSTVSVQYVGVLYKTGASFDSSWARGKAASFAMTGVIQGFTQGISGTGKVTPMRVGGRRIIVMPASLGYGSDTSNASIPPNSPLVFVVDLLSVT